MNFTKLEALSAYFVLPQYYPFHFFDMWA